MRIWIINLLLLLLIFVLLLLPHFGVFDNIANKNIANKNIANQNTSAPAPTTTNNANVPVASTSTNTAILLQVKGVISPANQNYVERGIDYAIRQNAKFVILQLDTPGGLESSMRGIVQAITHSSIPVIVYVGPTGSRAASAGTFIAYAGHISAMAPGTNIGAASPVDILGMSATAPEQLTTEQKKAINDASAFIRSLAQLNGKNSQWGESAVRNSASISAEEAKNLKVIDVIANNQQELLQQLNGRTVHVNGGSVKLDTHNVQITEVPPDWRYQFLSIITNPNVAYLLLLVAIYGLFFEFSSPGLVIPGVCGVIALILVLYAFQIIPVNYTGLTLLLVGVVFMVCEVYISSFGILGIAGVIAFIIGSIMLFDFNDQHYHLAWILIILMCILTFTFFFMVLSLAIASYKKAIVTGREGLIGTEGVVMNAVNEHALVRVLGEIWEAKSNEPLQSGQVVKVTNVHGLTLTVKSVKSGQPNSR